MELSMKSLKRCVMSTSCLLLFQAFLVLVSAMPTRNSADCRNSHGYKYFFDIGTKRCEKCREICENAELMWTMDQCQAECKEYLKAMGCVGKEDEYYDEAMRTCASCSPICDNYETTGTIRACKLHCSAYLDKLTPKQVPSRHRQNHLKALDGSELEQQEDSNSVHSASHPGYIALMALGGLLLVCLGVGASVYAYRTRWRPRQQYDQARREEISMQVGVSAEATPTTNVIEDDRSSSGGRAVQPVEETSPCLVGPPQFAIDVALPLALADLHRA